MSRSARYFHVAAWIWLLIAWILHQPSPAENASDHTREGFHAAILVSRHIRPYMEALEGLSQGLTDTDELSHEVHILDKYDLEHQELTSSEIAGSRPDLLISIGPEATSLAWDLSAELQVPVIYSMVLNPEDLGRAGPGSRGCGISLNIPPEIQLEKITSVLPGVRRLGVLFDPAINSARIRAIQDQAASHAVQVVPLSVESAGALPGVLEQGLGMVDALWLIPDETVISQALVKYIIREGIYQGIPSIGYNRFFYDSGAAAAFVLDFHEIGQQTAHMAREWLVSGNCIRMIPSFEVLVNTRVLDKMDLYLGEERP
ncbi:MAG: ABC transporter substrate-binding protein [Desulfonatronovibrionaceae bacterium]